MINYIFFIFFIIFSYNIHADQNDQRLDYLFDILIESNNYQEINQTIQNIWLIWLETEDPLIENEFKKGLELMKKNKLNESIDSFTKVIEQKPDFAEVWNKRATVYFLIGDFHNSINDINKTLNLEPRHFGAMDGLALIFIYFKQYKNAVDVYNNMLKIFPNNIYIINKRDNLLEKIYQRT
tara:strand:- start:3269 stop:3811 length:543 start_codon:yes stop_codon:yes gene_type:complete